MNTCIGQNIKSNINILMLLCHLKQFVDYGQSGFTILKWSAFGLTYRVKKIFFFNLRKNVILHV